MNNPLAQNSGAPIAVSQQATAIQPNEEERFSTNMDTMIALVVDMVKMAKSRGARITDPAIIELAGSFLRQYPKTELITNFIYYSKDHWATIKAQDMDFFINHAAKIFGNLPVDHVTAFRDLVVVRDDKGNLYISEDDIADLWKYFQSLVKICIKFIHRERGPYAQMDKGGVDYKYRKEFMPEINIPMLAQDWKLAQGLEWGPITNNQ